ncbi:MAG: rhodanese-like domain-containing protein [Candidatus Thorarchaeota archaeon]
MKTISTNELKEKLDNGDSFKLVFTLGDWYFRAMHIPGSISVHNPEEAPQYLSKDDEIVVYCSNPECSASQVAYISLEKAGFKNLRRFAGGLEAWQKAGYDLEGEMVD